MIRRGGADDRDDLVKLIAEFYGIDGHPFDAATVGAGLDPLLADDRHGTVLLLADGGGDGGGPIGYCVLTWGWSIEGGGLEGLIDELFVRQRGDGHGAVLLAAALTAARAHGCRRVFLETEVANDAARRFYLRHGFAVEDSIWMVHPLG